MTLQARLAFLCGVLIILISTHWYAYRSGGENQSAKLKLQYAATLATAQKEARAKEQAYQAQLQKAHHDAQEREKKLRGAAAAARAESVRLRNDIAGIRRSLPDLTEQAVRRYADTASVVLGECQSEYTALAEDADRLATERQLILEAWPK